MSDLEKLSHDEKVFLAGCVKSLILSDGSISETELSDLDELAEIEGFYDFDECLAEFEEEVKNNDDFFNRAKEITSRATRELILKYLDEISLQNGFPAREERIFLDELVKIWS
jgi:hypothetical protein